MGYLVAMLQDSPMRPWSQLHIQSGISSMSRGSPTMTYDRAVQKGRRMIGIHTIWHTTVTHRIAWHQGLNHDNCIGVPTRSTHNPENP